MHYSSVGVNFINITAYNAAIYSVAQTEICTCFLNFWPDINKTWHIMSSYNVLERMFVLKHWCKKGCTLCGGILRNFILFSSSHLTFKKACIWYLCSLLSSWCDIH